MFNDTVLDARLHGDDDASDRRISPRAPVIGELMVSWIGHTGTAHRYRLVDQSEHGYRLYSTLPIPAGTTGTVTALLGSNEGHVPPDDPVVVAWFRRSDGSGYDIGLRRLQP